MEPNREGARAYCFALLGPLEVQIASAAVDIRGKRRRALLTRLLMAPNLPIDSGLLCEDLWDGSPPSGAASTLQSHLSQLRVLLGPDRIRGAGGAVTLKVARGELDVQSFEQEVHDGTTALQAGNSLQALELLDSALKLWRGPALADVAGSVWALAERSRLDELRLVAIETSLDARLGLGDHQHVIPVAEALLREHPFRESVAGQLMLALYRAGRQAESLRVYQRVKNLLGEELGITPGRELTALESDIVLQRPELTPVRSIGPPGALGHGRAGPQWETTDAFIPLPSRLTARPAVGVVGREAELDQIREAFKRVSADEGREILLVSGEAGLGKTTLVAEAARLAFESGARVLLGHCEEDVRAPYGLFTEALGHFVDHATSDQLQILGSHAPELLPILPDLASRLPDLQPAVASDSDTERYLLFAAVVGVIRRLAQSEALVLVFDDLQWADKASLQLLRHLAAADQPMRLLVLGTYRDSELSRPHPLTDTLGALVRLTGMSRIDLTGLDDAGVVTFMEAASHSVLDDAAVDLAHAVYLETDGNPFFVGEVLRHLTETGALHTDESGWHVTARFDETFALPESIRVVIGARVGRLGLAAEQALSLAAVIGRDFDFDVLAGASAATEDELLEILDKAAAASLVRETAGTPGQYSFSHALIQHTLYQDLGGTRRSRAHRRIAETLDDLYGDRPTARLGELARHWVTATQPSDVLKAIGYSLKAGEAALAALAPENALRYFSQAFELLPQAGNSDAALEIDIATGLGTAQRQTGDRSFRDTLLRAAHRAGDLDDTDRLVAAVLALDTGDGSGTIDPEKVEVLEMALERLPSSRFERALLLGILCDELIFGAPFERCQALADEALAIAESSGNDVLILQILLRGSFLAPGLLVQGLERTALAVTLAERIGDPVLLMRAASRRYGACICAGDLTEADRCIEISNALADRLGQPHMKLSCKEDMSLRALLAGDADLGEQLATEAMQLSLEIGNARSELVFSGHMMTASWIRGTLGDLVPLIDQVAASNPGFAVFAAVLTHAHAEGDDLDAAAAGLDTLATNGYAIPEDGLWLTGMMSYAEAAIACRTKTHAAALLNRLAPLADYWGYMQGTSAGPVSRALGGLSGVLDRYEEADAFFARAVAACDAAEVRYFGALARLQWGLTLIERGGPANAAQAAHLLTEARTTSLERGYGRVARRATAAL